jgi:hypothetical protein
MEFLITEAQLKTILTEQDKSKMTNDMKELYSFTENLVNRVKAIYGINLRMLLTWGTSVGGLIAPLDEFIKTGNFNLTEEQGILILAAVASMLFFENKRGVSKLIEKIKEEGVLPQFEQILSKGHEIKSAFVGFLSSINITIGSLMEVAAYSFLIPIIFDITAIAESSTNLRQSSLQIVERLLASGVIGLSGQALTVTIRKILKKLK